MIGRKRNCIQHTDLSGGLQESSKYNYSQIGRQAQLYWLLTIKYQIPVYTKLQRGQYGEVWKHGEKEKLLYLNSPRFCFFKNFFFGVRSRCSAHG